MKYMKKLLTAFLAVTLVACGGGGGNPGTASGIGTSSGSTTGGVATAITLVPTITPVIVDSSYSVVPSNSIGSGSLFYVQATVLDANGAVVSNKLVNFTTDVTVATLAQGSALTGANGIARIQISPVGLSAVKAGNLVASTTVKGTPVSGSLDYQTAAANVTLTNMTAAQRTLNALQSTAVTVEGRINGALAGNGVVTVNFLANCGSFSPASATTNSLGLVNTVYQSAVSCSGSVALSAQATGATNATYIANVIAALPANVVYSSATVPLMVTSQAPSGLKQSAVKFQVLDGSGSGMSGQAVDVSLSASAISSGVTFFGGATTAQAVTTDASGFAQVIIISGSLPTPVGVTAALRSNATLKASSSGLSVTSGVPTQNSASLSATKLSIEGFNVDGVQSTLSWRISDRQGNPISPGAVVNFVTRSNATVQGTCLIDANSQCSVTFTSGGLRPTNGRVTILAYMDGEESFVDQNGDNIWQSTEPFFDVGTMYLDIDESGAYDVATEQTYPGGMVGASACSTVQYSYPSVANTCDGTWSSSVRVRRQITVTLATSEAKINLASARTSSGFNVTVTDLNGNAMPTDTRVSAAVKTNGATCTVTSTSPNVVRNSPNGGVHVVQLDAAADCITTAVDVTVTSPAGVSTIVRF
jgi:hypothetical protein